MSSASALATQPNARSLAPILQASLISGRDPAQSALFAPRSPTQLPAAAAQLEPGERLRFFRGQLVNRLRDEQHAGRIEVSSLSDVGGHGRYNGEEGSAISTADELSNVLPPSCVPERFHLHGANGRRIFPSENPTGRDEVEHLEAVYDTLLEEAGDDMLKQLDARDIVLAEIARQVHPHCAERSELLVRIKSLLYLHTSEALPLVDRVEAVEKALQEKREQLAAMEKDHAALTASRNRLNATPGAMPAKRVLRAAISDEIAAKAPNPLVSEFRRITSVADRLQLLSEVFARLESNEQLTVVGRALDALPAEHVSALMTEQLETLGPSDALELMLVSLRAGTPHFGLLQTTLNQLPPRKMVELIDALAQAWNEEEGGEFATTLFNGLATDDRLAVLNSFRQNLSEEEYVALLGHGLTERQRETLKRRLALRQQQRSPSAALGGIGFSKGTQAPEAGGEEGEWPLTDKEAFELAAKNHQAAWVYFDRANAWSRYASAVQVPTSDALDMDQILLTIAELYDDKIKANAAADQADASRPAWPQFVFIWMMQRHSVKSRAMTALGALLHGAVKGAAESARLRLFCILSGLSLQHVPSPRRVDIVLAFIASLFPNEVRERFAVPDGALFCALYDSGVDLSATEAVSMIRDRHLRTYSKRLMEACEKATNERRLVNVDQLLLAVVEAFEDMTLKLNAGLEQLLQRFDVDGDGVLSLAEFSSMCSKLNREASEETVHALFMEVQEASERINPSIGDALLPRAFVEVMQGTEGFIDTEAFLDFLREMRQMPQEDE